MSVALYYIIPFIIILGILISFHEFGHYLVAKLFNVKVLKFSVGFGPKIMGKTIGETEYLISALPLGGYVKLLGENDDEEEEEIKPEDVHRAFFAQSPLKKIAIALAGPFFNFILAFFLFSGAYMVSGNPVMMAEVGQVRPDSPASKGGISKGDVVESIEGQEIDEWNDIKKCIEKNPGRTLEVGIRRGEKRVFLKILPEEEIVKNIFGEDVKSALIGIVASGKIKEIQLNPVQAIAEGGRRTWEITALTFITIGKLFKGAVPLKMLGGPIMIGQLTGDIARENISYLFPFMAVISVNLAVLNLLPIPILDGGLILFFLIEILIRRPVSIKKREMAQKVGFFVLILLMAVVFYNDLARIIAG